VNVPLMAIKLLEDPTYEGISSLPPVKVKSRSNSCTNKSWTE